MDGRKRGIDLVGKLGIQGLFPLAKCIVLASILELSDLCITMTILQCSVLSTYLPLSANLCYPVQHVSDPYSIFLVLNYFLFIFL